MPAQRQIDLNCDMGESFGLYSYGHDAAMMPGISSANIACGFHAGDPAVMRQTVAAAGDHGVRLGAHVGYPDRRGFGRRAMQISPADLAADTLYQLGALSAFAIAAGSRLHHLKPHGALYMAALTDPALARAIVESIAAFDPSLLLYTIRDSATWQAAQAAGIRPVAEFFADRPYHADGQVKMFDYSLDEAGGSPAALAARVVQLVTTGTIPTLAGTTIPMAADTVCIHADTPGAPAILAATRAALAAADIAIAPPARG